MSSSAQPEKRVLVVGLPASGKSTFIGALYNSLEEAALPTSCTWQTTPEDAAYVQELAVAWAQCRPPERNSLRTRREIRLNLKKVDNGETFELVFPDVAGELFERQWQLRAYPPSYQEDIDHASGVMLFVSPHIRSATLIGPEDASMAAMFSKLLGLNPTKEVTEESSLMGFDASIATSNQRALVQELARHPERTPTQVMLVELLQFIARRRGLGAGVCPVAVVVSMWDEILTTHFDGSAGDWLAAHLPLLNQYLLANDRNFDFRVFGISAQGGSYEEPDQLRKLSSIVTKRASRIILDAPEGQSHDLTLPIAWIIQQTHDRNSAESSCAS